MKAWTELLRSLVRIVVTLGVAGTVIYLAVMGKVSPSEFLALAGPIIGYWFGQREREKEIPPPN